MKKVYITGLAGLLGSNLAFAMKDKYQVYGCDRNLVQMADVKSEQFDILEDGKIESELLKIHPDIVINSAALVNVDTCETEIVLAKRMNADIPKRIVEVCKQMDAVMIQVSTDAVYSDLERQLHAEISEIKPLNWYATTKYDGEQPVLEYSKGIVLRTNIYGFNMREKYSFGEWILNAFKSHSDLNMFTDVLFSPILVNDFAKILDCILDQNVFGLYNLCATGAISKYEFGLYMRDIFEYPEAVINPITSELINLKALRSKNMGMSNQKLCNILNVRIRTPQESIEQFKKLYDSGYAEKIKIFGGKEYYAD